MNDFVFYLKKKLYLIMERTYSQSEMNSLKKQEAFAWAKVFEYHRRSADDTAVFVEIFGRENGILV